MHWSCCHVHCFAFQMPCSIMLCRHCNAANSFGSQSISAAVLAEVWRHVCSVLRCWKHNITHALIVLSCALLCVSDAMQHHAMEALQCSKLFQVAINQCCSACRGMAACIFCANKLEAQHYSCIGRAVMPTALRFRCNAASRCGGIAMQPTV